MPAFEVMDLNQTAVLWGPTTPDGYGQMRVDPTAGREIPCRWVWKRDTATDPQADVTEMTATITVNEEVPVGAILFLGTLDEWLGTGSGSGEVLDENELMEVQSASRTPDLKNRNVRRDLTLRRFQNQLPT